MQNVFEKVTFDQFMKDWTMIFSEEESNTDYIRYIYDKIKVPELNEYTNKYDFFIPENFEFYKDSETLVPTGIRFNSQNNNDVLLISSGEIFEGYKLFADDANDTVMVIDSNDHIIVNMVNVGNNDLYFEKDDVFCTGMIKTKYNYGNISEQ